MAILNYDFYTGEDKYSDGEIEDYFLKNLRNGAKENEILESKPNDWATFYHFSHLRWNLLRWIELKNKKILEVGGGCGALSGLFLQDENDLTVIELSKRRAQIIHERFKRFNNLKIYVGAAQDIKIEEQFDVVTSIGVLEYAAFIYPKEMFPQKRLLSYFREKLAPQGKLVLAIENVLGMKYFAGAAEDHTRKMFDGITGYQETLIRTFGRSELETLLKDAGFGKLQFFYPYPDYKFCDQIFSDDYLPRINDLYHHHVPNYDQERFALYNERLLSNTLIANKLVQDFMNSFLIIAEV